MLPERPTASVDQSERAERGPVGPEGCSSLSVGTAHNLLAASARHALGRLGRCHARKYIYAIFVIPHINPLSPCWAAARERGGDQGASAAAVQAEHARSGRGEGVRAGRQFRTNTITCTPFNGSPTTWRGVFREITGSVERLQGCPKRSFEH